MKLQNKLVSELKLTIRRKAETEKLVDSGESWAFSLWKVKMNVLELIVIAVTIVSVFLTGNKNNWTWLFAILANVIWLIIGLQRSITVIIICSCIYLVLSFRGAYLWIFKNNKGEA